MQTWMETIGFRDKKKHSRKKGKDSLETWAIFS